MCKTKIVIVHVGLGIMCDIDEAIDMRVNFTTLFTWEVFPNSEMCAEF
jgi:hypothetical protein